MKLVALDRNLGFGAGNNRGIAEASGRFVFLLNSDAFVDRRLHRRAGAVLRGAPALRCGGARGCAGRTGGCNGPAAATRASTGWRRSTCSCASWRPRSTMLNAFYCGGFEHDLPRRVDWLTGAAVLLRREALGTPAAASTRRSSCTPRRSTCSAGSAMPAGRRGSTRAPARSTCGAGRRAATPGRRSASSCAPTCATCDKHEGRAAATPGTGGAAGRSAAAGAAQRGVSGARALAGGAGRGRAAGRALHV